MVRRITGFRRLAAAGLAVALASQASTTVALAQDGAPGSAQLAEGRFEEAVEIGRLSGSAEGLTIACRAGLAIGGYMRDGEEAVAWLHDAIRDCARALSIDPDLHIAKVSYAMGVGFEGKRLKSPGLVSTARRYIEEALEDEPESPLAKAALGGWHGSVSLAGALAKITLGARHSDALELYDQAAQASTNIDIPMRFEYAKYLLRRGKKYREKAVAILNEILTSEPNDYFDQYIIQPRAGRVLAVVEEGDKDEIVDTVLSVSPFYQVEEQRDLDKVDIEIPEKAWTLPQEMRASTAEEGRAALADSKPSSR